MQPHVNLGINFRKHFELHPTKKRLLRQILQESIGVERDYKYKRITREEGMRRMNALTSIYLQVKDALFGKGRKKK